MSPSVPERRTRRPTGKPPWPMILLAGGEKSGKSWAAAEFSASDLIGKTFFIEIGEHYADEYGRLPGVRYEIVEHDGTYRDIKAAVQWAVAQPRIDGKPNCVVFDSATPLWEMLSDEAQRTANRRWRKKNPAAPEPDEEVQVTMDLWNVAKGKFADVMRELYQYDGPTIVTARLEQVAVVGAGGKPTNEKAWKVRAEKNLPFEVDAVIQAREPRKFIATGLRSTRFQLEPGEQMAMPGFTVDGFLRRLGHDEPDATAPRAVTPLRLEDGPQHAVADAVVRKEQHERAQRPAASEDQRRTLVLLMRDKLGIVERPQRIAAMSKHLGRRIDSFTDLTSGEAHATIKALAAMADRVPATGPAAEPGPQMPHPGPVVEPQPPAPRLDQGFRLPSAVGPEGICTDMLAAIGACADKEQLVAVGERIKEMAGNGILHQSHRERLDAAWRTKNTALTPPVPAEPDRYTELAELIGRAGLEGDDGVDALVAAATQARADGVITSMQLGVLTNMAEGRAQDLLTTEPPTGGWSRRALAEQGAPL
jgi:hypothetical protein